MEIKKTAVLDSSEPLSKALPQLDTTPAVIITKNGKYYGLIDHRSVGKGIRDPRNTKCESAIVKPPVMVEGAGVIETTSAFLLGHFKALPVVDDAESPLGITTRIETLQAMMEEKLIPGGKVSELMNSPVFSISEDEKVAGLKKALRENNARRMVVISRGNPIGVVSDFDIGSWTSRPNLKGGRKDVHLSDKLDIDDLPIKGFLRPDITTLEDSKTIDDAVKRMIEKRVSSVVVVSGKKAVGVLSALDIFKKIQEMTSERLAIQISGLSEEQMGHYEHIRDKFGGVLEKFRESLNIRNVHVHTKQRKSVVTVNLGFDSDEGHITLRGERADLKETVDELAGEADRVLRKRKEQRRQKPRASRYGGASGTRYL